MRSKPYPRYKPSGVNWLGDIPEAWTVKRLKYVASINESALPETTPPDFELKYVDIGGVDPVRGIVEVKDFDFENAPSRARRVVHDGDTIVSTVRTYLRAIAPIKKPPENLVVSTGFAVVRPRKIDSDYLSYVLQESRFVETIVAASVGVSYPAINASDVGKIEIPLPSNEEQRLIAGFLGGELTKIDALVTKKQRLIERLREQRAAVISRTVIRGLPPRAARSAGLDPDPKLKPSGIDWLGDVPAHWEIEKFSRVVRIAEGQVDPEDEEYASMLLIAPNHVESGTGRLLARETSGEQGAISGKYLCHRGEVIYSKIRPALAKATLAPDDCLCSADMYPMAPIGEFRSRYLLFLLLSPQFTAWSVLEADRVAMPKINRETLNDLRVGVPSPPEQDAIADFLEGVTRKIDRLVVKAEAVIGRLQEYRSALMTAAVTGKIDVREKVADNRRELASVD